MNNGKTSLNKGSTKLRKMAVVQLKVFMEPEDTKEDLYDFIKEFFLEMGDYEHVEFVIKEEQTLLMVPYDDEQN